MALRIPARTMDPWSEWRTREPERYYLDHYHKYSLEKAGDAAVAALPLLRAQ